MNVSAGYLGVIINTSQSNKFFFEKSHPRRQLFKPRSKGKVKNQRFCNVFRKIKREHFEEKA